MFAQPQKVKGTRPFILRFFFDTSSPSWTRLPLGGHIFPFWAHLPRQGVRPVAKDRLKEFQNGQKPIRGVPVTH